MPFGSPAHDLCCVLGWLLGHVLGEPRGAQADPGPSGNSSSPLMSSETSGEPISLPEPQSLLWQRGRRGSQGPRLQVPSSASCLPPSGPPVRGSWSYCSRCFYSECRRRRSPP